MYNHLYHRESKERDNHKYVARVLLKKGSGGTPNIYRYFYDKEKYQTYLKGKQKTQIQLTSKKNENNGLSSIVKNLNIKLQNKNNTTKSLFSTAISKGEEFSKKFIGENGKKSMKEVNGKVTNKIEKIGYDTLMFGLKNVLASKVYEAYVDVKEKVKPFEQKKNSPADIKQRAEDAKTTPKEQKEQRQFSDLKIKKKGYTNEEDMNLINPKYNNLTYDYNMNCSYCTAAYDMRQRGFDVEAAPINIYRDDSTNIYELASWYKGTEIKTCDEINDMLTDSGPYYSNGKKNQYDPKKASDILEEQLKQNGEGSRGFLCLYWTGGGGHAVAWEVENGEVVIRDCQTNKVVETVDYMSLSCDIDYFRTDNLELSDEIRKVVRNRE